MKSLLLALFASLGLQIYASAAGEEWDSKVTKRLFQHDITVFAQSHGPKIHVRILVEGLIVISVLYAGIDVVGLDQDGKEMPLELVRLKSYKEVEYKLTLHDQRQLQAVRVTWYQDTATFPIESRKP